MAEEKKNITKMEIDDQELESVSGGFSGANLAYKPAHDPKGRTLSCCPQCNSQNIRRNGSNDYFCSDCGAHFGGAVR